MSENRINPTSTASAPKPGAGGWTPSSWFPLIGACAAGALTGVGAYLGSGAAPSTSGIVGAALAGCGTGVAAFFGIKSAGPRAVR